MGALFMLKNRWLVLVILSFLNFQITSKPINHDRDLLIAVLNNDINQVRTLLNEGADPNIKNYKPLIKPFSDISKQRDLLNGSIKPLHIAAYRGNTEIAQMLLDAGANPNSPDKNGNTPLHMAIVRNHPKIAKMLLNKKADINIKNKLNYKPSDLVWDEEILQILLEKGADPEVLNSLEGNALRNSSTFKTLMNLRKEAARKQNGKDTQNSLLKTVSHTFDTVYKNDYAKHLKDKFMISKQNVD